MADYYRQGDQARSARSQAESIRRLRTRRPRDTNVPSLGWHLYGQVTLDWVFIPQPVALDAGLNGAPEHKQIVAIDGWLSASEVTLDWEHNSGYFYEGHVISGGSGNRIVFDGQSGRPDPFIIENGDVYGGEWLRPVVAEEPAFPAFLLCAAVFIETVPV